MVKTNRENKPIQLLDYRNKSSGKEREKNVKFKTVLDTKSKDYSIIKTTFQVVDPGVAASP
jgi:hypothetical protein